MKRNYILLSLFLSACGTDPVSSSPVPSSEKNTDAAYIVKVTECTASWNDGAYRADWKQAVSSTGDMTVFASITGDGRTLTGSILIPASEATCYTTESVTLFDESTGTKQYVQLKVNQSTWLLTVQYPALSIQKMVTLNFDHVCSLQ